MSTLHAVLTALHVPLGITNQLSELLGLAITAVGRAFNALTSPLRETHGAVNSIHAPSWLVHAAFSALHVVAGFVAEQFGRLLRMSTEFWREVLYGGGIISAFSLLLYNMGINTQTQTAVSGALHAVLVYGEGVWRRMTEAVNIAIMAAKMVYETAFPALKAAADSIWQSLGIMNTSVDSTANSHLPNMAGSITTVKDRAVDWFGALASGLAFLAVTVPANIQSFALWFRWFADVVAETMRQAHSAVAMSNALMHGNIAEFNRLNTEDTRAGIEAQKRLNADWQRAKQSDEELADGTVERRAAAFKDQMISNMELIRGGTAEVNRRTTAEHVADATTRHEQVASQARQQRDDVIAAANGANLYGAGVSVAQGFADGIYARKNAAVQAAREMAGEVEYATGHAIQASSPSRVFMQLGGYVPEGFALGIQGGKQTAVNAVTSMVQGVTAAAGGGLSGSLSVTPTVTAAPSPGGVGGTGDPELLRRLVAALSARPAGSGGDIVLRLDSRELARVVFDQGSERWKLLGGTLGSGA